jgi:adenine-specific DNA-methyltransferase
MTTDPGDLVLDPTCGSGTTAYAAEQWGRRWITIDTSRVALSLARQRLMTATFPNTRIDPVAEKYQAQIDALVAGGAAEDSPQVRELKLAQKREIDAIIAADAEQEVLYDQPREERGVVRVSGPFTVEAIPPAALSLLADSPIGGAPDALEPDGAGEEVHAAVAGDPAGDAAVIARLIDLLRADGVTFPNNRKLTFDDLRPAGSGVIHAEGEAAEDSTLGRVAISFGPQNGAVSARQVEDGIYQARRGAYDAIVFAGFSFQAEAHQAIELKHPNLQVFLSHIRPDVIMTDARGESLLKTTANSQLFAVFGEPDVELRRGDDGTFTIELHGVDVYDPLDGSVVSARANQIAAWFLDTDYDGRTFAICQAFFPDGKAWDKLERALKGTLDAERFDQLTGTLSLPFVAGQHGRVACKVIDQRGNEVMRVVGVEDPSPNRHPEGTRPARGGEMRGVRTSRDST